jgi:hypothetical protein
MESLYPSDCVFRHQYLLNKSVIKQFILFYAAHTIAHSIIISYTELAKSYAVHLQL